MRRGVLRRRRLNPVNLIHCLSRCASRHVSGWEASQFEDRGPDCPRKPGGTAAVVDGRQSKIGDIFAPCVHHVFIHPAMTRAITPNWTRSQARPVTHTAVLAVLLQDTQGLGDTPPSTTSEPSAPPPVRAWRAIGRLAHVLTPHVIALPKYGAAAQSVKNRGTPPVRPAVS